MALAARRRAVPRVMPLVAVIALVAGACSLTTSVTGPREWSQTVESDGGTTRRSSSATRSGRLTNVEIDPGMVSRWLRAQQPCR